MCAVKRVFGVVIGFGALGGALACGPSFQAIYEGNARFEHCYALEESAQKPAVEKVDCWRDWSEHYTYGQTRDRIHYATARYVALSQSTSVPTDEAMMMAAPGMTPRQSSITAPAPTNAFAPPPKVLDDYPDASWGRPLRPSERPVILGAGPVSSGDAGSGAGGASIVDAGSVGDSGLPAATCGDGCGMKFRECSMSCASGDGGSKSAACANCERTYKACMRGCFK